MIFILLIIRVFPFTPHRNTTACHKSNNTKIPLRLQAILFPGKPNLTDNRIDFKDFAFLADNRLELREARAPVMTFEGNMGDEREFARGRPMSRIDAFMETLGLRKIAS